MVVQKIQRFKTNILKSALKIDTYNFVLPKTVLNDASLSSSIQSCCKYIATQFNTDQHNQARGSDARCYLLPILLIIFLPIGFFIRSLVYDSIGKLCIRLGIIINSGGNHDTFKGWLLINKNSA